MAKYVVTRAKVTINGTDFSANVASASLELTTSDVDVTNFGSGGWTNVIGGLKSGTLSLDFHHDYGLAALSTTLNPLLGTIATVTLNPDGTAPSVSNPTITVQCLVNSVTPVSGAVGDLATFSVSWPTNGSVTYATA